MKKDYIFYGRYGEDSPWDSSYFGDQGNRQLLTYHEALSLGKEFLAGIEPSDNEDEFEWKFEEKEED